MINNIEDKTYIDDMKNIKIHCSSTEELYDTLKFCAKHHITYRVYYKDIKIIDKIINGGLVLRSKDFNDVLDSYKMRDSKDGYVKFMLCFTYSISENVAMWYMYGGNRTNNVMVKYSLNMIEDIILYDVNINYGIFDKTKFVKKGEINKKDCIFEMVDCLYIEKKRDRFYAKHSDDACYIQTDVIKGLEPYIIKNNAWGYENECRLIVKVPKELITENIDAIQMPLPDEVIKTITKKKKIVTSPFCDVKTTKYRTVESKLKGLVKI